MPHDDSVLLSEYFDRWIDRRRLQLRPTTVDTYERAIDTYLRPHLGTTPLTQLDRRMLERTYAGLLARGGRDGRPLSPGTVQRAHTVLRSALKDAHLDGLIDDNPAEHARPPKRRHDDVEAGDGPKAWTSEQAATFLQAVDTHRWRAVWHLALGTGARRGEVLGLRWCDVDLDTETVVIRRSLSVVGRTARLLKTKSSPGRVLSIGSSVVSALHRRRRVHEREQADADDWYDDWGLVFTHRSGRHIHPSGVTKEFRRLVQELPVPVIRLHDLRHTHASILLAAGVPIKVISDRLGHSSITTTMDTYAHLLPAMDQNAAAALANALREVE